MFSYMQDPSLLAGIITEISSCGLSLIFQNISRCKATSNTSQAKRKNKYYPSLPQNCSRPLEVRVYGFHKFSYLLFIACHTLYCPFEPIIAYLHRSLTPVLFLIIDFKVSGFNLFPPLPVFFIPFYGPF